jgi:hypothetical protein
VERESRDRGDADDCRLWHLPRGLKQQCAEADHDREGAADRLTADHDRGTRDRAGCGSRGGLDEALYARVLLMPVDEPSGDDDEEIGRDEDRDRLRLSSGNATSPSSNCTTPRRLSLPHSVILGDDGSRGRR